MQHLKRRVTVWADNRQRRGVPVAANTCSRGSAAAGLSINREFRLKKKMKGGYKERLMPDLFIWSAEWQEIDLQLSWADSSFLVMQPRTYHTGDWWRKAAQHFLFSFLQNTIVAWQTRADIAAFSQWSEGRAILVPINKLIGWQMTHPAFNGKLRPSSQLSTGGGTSLEMNCY